MKKLLITGFAPFGGDEINPSWEAIKHLPVTVGEYSLTRISLPVVYGAAAKKIISIAKTVMPDVILCIGQAGGRSAVTPEMLGINLRHATIPDCAGKYPQDQPIKRNGANAYFSTVPVRTIAAAIKEAGIPAEVSYSAGTYVCNDTFYSLLAHYKNTNTKVGFIHIPYCEEQNKQPCMSMSDIVKALTVAIESMSESHILTNQDTILAINNPDITINPTECPQTKNNFYLTARERGSSYKLCGKVNIMSFFMRRSEDEFSEDTCLHYLNEHKKLANFLESEAERYGVKLKITPHCCFVATHGNANPFDGYKLLNKFWSYRTTADVKKFYTNYHSVDETPILIVFDEDNRSFSSKQMSNSDPNQDEYSVIFRKYGDFNWKTMAHELLHQFGAADLYFPTEVSEFGKMYLGESIMTSRGETVDDLTAYLVGWKDTVSLDTYRFLQSTSWITEEIHAEILKTEWKRKLVKRKQND